MDTIKASLWWPGPDLDMLHLYAEPMPKLWEADPVGESGLVALYEELDEQERTTGRIVGAEIDAFLEFAYWQDIPSLPILWQLTGREPLPLEALLRQVQQELRREAAVAAHRASA